MNFERGAVMGSNIRQKIMRNTGIILACMLILFFAFAYYCVSVILKDRVVNDDRAKVHQAANQLQYIMDDVRKFCATLIVDPEVQSFLISSPDPDAFQNLVEIHECMERLTDYQYQREYVSSVAVITKDGAVYWNKMAFDSYFREKTQ